MHKNVLMPFYRSVYSAMKRLISANTRTKKLAVAIIFNQFSQRMDTVSHSIRDIRKRITKSECWSRYRIEYSCKNSCINHAGKSTLIFTIFLKRTKNGPYTFNRKSKHKFMSTQIMRISAGIFVLKSFGIRDSLPNC